MRCASVLGLQCVRQLQLRLALQLWTVPAIWHARRQPSWRQQKEEGLCTEVMHPTILRDAAF